MGCCLSSPHAARVYRDTADLDEEIVPLRYFGTFRSGSNLVPDDIDGLPSTHIAEHLAANSDVILYEATIDSGYAFRCGRLAYCCLFTPWGLAYVISQGCRTMFEKCSCDEICCYLRKEYSTRRFFRVYSNRIEINQPTWRFPWGILGCGSWNADVIQTHPFDRGAFGFQRAHCAVIEYLCCIWPVYGGAVARHRCQCHGPVWNRMFTDCGGWWCEEWPCVMTVCTFNYGGLADADEVAFVCSIALQAYFEGRVITPEDMQKCIAFWKDHISEQTDPLRRKREVCCEPYYIPWPDCSKLYRCIHPKRNIPYGEDKVTNDIKEVYENYENERVELMETYTNFTGPVRNSTVCRAFGCRRFFGRKGVIFCTEGCTNCSRKAGEPAPPFEEHDFDDDWDATTVLMQVVGPPPANVVIRRWRWDPESNENVLETYPEEVKDK